jgi:uncharacterized protein
MDTLRGVAVLGILVMNIPWFARSESKFFNPMTGGGFEGADYWTWLLSHLLFDFKMMTIFSMLFGAGMLVFTERAAAAGRSAAAIYYRRLGWLLLFGLLHAYLLWSGDILYSYALCGLLLYPARRLRPRWLIAIGLALLLIGTALTAGSGWWFATARSAAEAGQAALDAGGTPTEFQRGMVEAWPAMREQFVPTPERLAAEEAAHLGSYGELFVFRARQAIFMQTGLFLLMLLWRATGVMLIGMALMKLGVFTAARSIGFYLGLLLVGYAVGLPLVAVGAWQAVETRFDFVVGFKYVWHFNYVGSLFVALGHVGLVILIGKLGVLTWLTSGLAAVGRMALTNYLSHSLICAAVFYGWGLGMFNQWSRFETLALVAAIWLFQFVFSQVWLARFHFGPMEWLWRTLTYWQPQPVRREAAGAPALAGTRS